MKYRLEYPLKGGKIYFNNEVFLESTIDIKLFHSINKIYDNNRDLLVEYRFSSFLCIEDIIILNQYLLSELKVHNKLCSFYFTYNGDAYKIHKDLLNSYKLQYNNETIAIAKGDNIFSCKYDIEFFIEDRKIHFNSLIVFLLALTDKGYNTV